MKKKKYIFVFLLSLFSPLLFAEAGDSMAFSGSELFRFSSSSDNFNFARLYSYSFVDLMTNPNAIVGLVQDSGSQINSIPVYSAIFPESIWAFLCDFRRIFCGRFAVVVAAVSVFTIGILILTNKITWPYAIMIITTIIIFANPELVTKIILSKSFTVGNWGLDLGRMTDVCQCVSIGSGCVSNGNGGPQNCL